MSLIPGSLRRGFEALLGPLVQGCIAIEVSPNVLTTVGTFLLVGSAAAFGLGAIRLGAFLLLLSGVFDMLDGRVARGSGRESRFGAFYDSTLDRIGESVLLGGILLYFAAGGVAERWELWALGITILALMAGLVVSYARARAEGLGVECKVGVMQRAERVLLLGVPTLFFGAGPGGLLLLGIVGVVAVLSSVTVVQRVLHVRNATRVVRRRTQARMVAPMLADLTKEGE